MSFAPKNNRRRFLIGYGSWLNQGVRAELFPSIGHVSTVVICGYRRVCKLERRAAESRCVRLGDSVLTLEKANKKTTFNGILFDVNETDYQNVISQVKLYTPFFKSCYDFETGKYVVGHGNIFIGYSQYCNLKIDPNKQHLEVCREGAYSFGKAFGKMFDETAYLTNGLTLAEYYKTPKV